MAHRIRLRQPWKRCVLEQEDTDESHVVFERHFNRPTGIQPGDQVEVEVHAAIGEIGEVRLNEVSLGQVPSTTPSKHSRRDISGRLADHNVLQVHLRLSNGEPELGDVQLWITTKENS